MCYPFSDIQKMFFTCRKNIVDPEDPRCVRLTLTGRMIAVSPEEVEFAKQAMFSRCVNALKLICLEIHNNNKQRSDCAIWCLWCNDSDWSPLPFSGNRTKLAWLWRSLAAAAEARWMPLESTALSYSRYNCYLLPTFDDALPCHEKSWAFLVNTTNIFKHPLETKHIACWGCQHSVSQCGVPTLKSVGCWLRCSFTDPTSTCLLDQTLRKQGSEIYIVKGMLQEIDVHATVWEPLL